MHACVVLYIPIAKLIIVDCRYGTSLGWFVNQFKAQNIEFDEIWAWEVSDIPQTQYWQVQSGARNPS